MERQAGKKISEIRQDHLNRYYIASNNMQSGFKVLDIACGVGYGSYILGKKKNVKLDAVDISEEAINHANKYFKRPNIQFHKQDVFDFLKETKNEYDLIISFETVEHLNEDKKFLQLLKSKLSNKGKLLVSTPNEDLLKYSKDVFPFHVKHYTTKYFIKMLNEKGFYIEKGYSQYLSTVINGFGAKFNIAVAVQKRCKEDKKIIYRADIIKKDAKNWPKELLDQEITDAWNEDRYSDAIELSKSFEKHNKIKSLYIKASSWKCLNNIGKAKETFKKCLELSIKDKKYKGAAAYHLSTIYKRNSFKKKYLQLSLKYIPDHKAAARNLKELVN